MSNNYETISKAQLEKLFSLNKELVFGNHIIIKDMDYYKLYDSRTIQEPNSEPIMEALNIVHLINYITK